MRGLLAVDLRYDRCADGNSHTIRSLQVARRAIAITWYVQSVGQSFMQRMADPQQAPHLGRILSSVDVEAALAQLESLLLPRRDPPGEALSLARRLRPGPMRQMRCASVCSKRSSTSIG